MNETAKDTSADQPPPVWRKHKMWGAVGLTHYAQVTINNDVYKFTIDQPRKGQWVGRGWRNGDFCMYRDGARTLAGMKVAVDEFYAHILATYETAADQ